MKQFWLYFSAKHSDWVPPCGGFWLGFGKGLKSSPTCAGSLGSEALIFGNGLTLKEYNVTVFAFQI